MFCKKRKIFGASRHLKCLTKIFNGTAMNNREEIDIFWFQEGEKIGTFVQNIYPWDPILVVSRIEERQFRGDSSLCTCYYCFTKAIDVLFTYILVNL